VTLRTWGGNDNCQIVLGKNRGGKRQKSSPHKRDKGEIRGTNWEEGKRNQEGKKGKKLENANDR